MLIVTLFIMKKKYLKIAANIVLHFNASNLYNIKLNEQIIISNYYNKCPEITSKYDNVKYIKSNNNNNLKIDEFNFDKHW